MVLCDYATISRENKLSINGIFEEIRLVQIPGGLARAFLVASLHGDSEKVYKVKITLEHEANKKNLLNPLELEVKTGINGKHNLIVELVNIGFEKEGEYTFTMYYGDDEVGSTRLQVMPFSAQPANTRVIN